jgi:hypothetical protein
MSLQHALPHWSYGLYHPTAPAPEKSRNCGLLRVQELMTMTTLRRRRRRQGWGSTEEDPPPCCHGGGGPCPCPCFPCCHPVVSSPSSRHRHLCCVVPSSSSLDHPAVVALGCFISPSPLHEQGLVAVVGWWGSSPSSAIARTN